METAVCHPLQECHAAALAAAFRAVQFVCSVWVKACLQRGSAAHCIRDPVCILQETLEYFANPDNLNTADVLPPGLANWDPAPYLASAIPIALSVIGVNFVHEIGHRIAAFIRGVKLGPTYFVPNLQIGSFGGITPLQSLLKNRSELWDVAAAGPLAGVSASIALLVVGLSQSHPGGLPQVGGGTRAKARGWGAGAMHEVGMRLWPSVLLRKKRGRVPRGRLCVEALGSYSTAHL